MTIDIENNREELGLPPRGKSRGRLVLAAVLVMALAAGAGLMLGARDREQRRQDFFAEWQELVRENDPDQYRRKLGELEKLRALLLDEPPVRLFMSRIYLHASGRLPAQQAYYSQALSELEAAVRLAGNRDNNAWQDEVDNLRAQIYTETNRHEEALTALERQGAKLQHTEGTRLSEKVLWMNSLAYLSAISENPRVSDPEKALLLAREMVAAEVALGETTPARSPALLDTLAAAYYATGDSAQAVRVQREALQLADSPDLSVYVRHYRDYLRAGKSSGK
jgi:tetratricopeptide (TPR) repeat protein